MTSVTPSESSSSSPMPPLPASGVVHRIVRWGEPAMHQVARPVTSFDEKLRRLAADMVATMYAADGVGLAACQIGSDAAMFVYDCPDASGTQHRGVICNPLLDLPEGTARKLDNDQEGCLSFPGAFVNCARPDTARIHGQDLSGMAVLIEGDGLLARCLQHETDHLNGMVFGDRLSDRARKKLTKLMHAAADDFPIDWPMHADPHE